MNGCRGRDGKEYGMAGVLHGECHKTSGLARFGYITMEAEKDNLLCPRRRDAEGPRIPLLRQHTFAGCFYGQKGRWIGLLEGGRGG